MADYKEKLVALMTSENATSYGNSDLSTDKPINYTLTSEEDDRLKQIIEEELKRRGIDENDISIMSSTSLTIQNHIMFQERVAEILQMQKIESSILTAQKMSTLYSLLTQHTDELRLSNPSRLEVFIKIPFAEIEKHGKQIGTGKYKFTYTTENEILLDDTPFIPEYDIDIYLDKTNGPKEEEISAYVKYSTEDTSIPTQRGIDGHSNTYYGIIKIPFIQMTIERHEKTFSKTQLERFIVESANPIHDFALSYKDSTMDSPKEILAKLYFSRGTIDYMRYRMHASNKLSLEYVYSDLGFKPIAGGKLSILLFTTTSKNIVFRGDAVISRKVPLSLDIEYAPVGEEYVSTGGVETSADKEYIRNHVIKLKGTRLRIDTESDLATYLLNYDGASTFLPRLIINDILRVFSLYTTMSFKDNENSFTIPTRTHDVKLDINLVPIKGISSIEEIETIVEETDRTLALSITIDKFVEEGADPIKEEFTYYIRNGKEGYKIDPSIKAFETWKEAQGNQFLKYEDYILYIENDTTVIDPYDKYILYPGNESYSKAYFVSILQNTVTSDDIRLNTSTGEQSYNLSDTKIRSVFSFDHEFEYYDLVQKDDNSNPHTASDMHCHYYGTPYQMSYNYNQNFLRCVMLSTYNKPYPTYVEYNNPATVPTRFVNTNLRINNFLDETTGERVFNLRTEIRADDEEFKLSEDNFRADVVFRNVEGEDILVPVTKIIDQEKDNKYFLQFDIRSNAKIYDKFFEITHDTFDANGDPVTKTELIPFNQELARLKVYTKDISEEPAPDGSFPIIETLVVTYACAIDVFTDVTKYLTIQTNVEREGYVNILMLPMVEYEFLNDWRNQMKVNNEINSIFEFLESNVYSDNEYSATTFSLKERQETLFSISFKFVNTYGRSKFLQVGDSTPLYNLQISPSFNYRAFDTTFATSIISNAINTEVTKNDFESTDFHANNTVSDILTGYEESLSMLQFIKFGEQYDDKDHLIQTNLVTVTNDDIPEVMSLKPIYNDKLGIYEYDVSYNKI